MKNIAIKYSYMTSYLTKTSVLIVTNHSIAMWSWMVTNNFRSIIGHESSAGNEISVVFLLALNILQSRARIWWRGPSYKIPDRKTLSTSSSSDLAAALTLWPPFKPHLKFRASPHSEWLGLRQLKSEKWDRKKLYLSFEPLFWCHI